MVPEDCLSGHQNMACGTAALRDGHQNMACGTAALLDATLLSEALGLPTGSHLGQTVLAR
jgi:hypothetical protein